MKIQSYMNRVNNSVFGKFENNTRNPKNKLIGTEYWIKDNDKRYIGLYRAPCPDFIGENNMDLIHCQGEFLNTTMGFNIRWKGIQKNICYL